MVKKRVNVTENLGLDPITDYNKSKMICKKLLKIIKVNLKL